MPTDTKTGTATFQSKQITPIHRITLPRHCNALLGFVLKLFIETRPLIPKITVMLLPVF